jgi:16S rRNA (guanine527-N7)-methyltransferase
MPGACEDVVNLLSGAPSLPAQSGPAAATDLSDRQVPWPGLASASAAVGVVLDNETLARFARYRDLLLSWNVRFNLTAIREPEEIERRLFLDALAMVPALDRVVAPMAKRTEKVLRLVDVGSGAGLPGLALKIARPEIDVTLIDATAKKVSFLEAVIAELALPAVRAVHGRAEDLGQDSAYRGQFDLATARAVASLPVLLEYVMPLLDIGGSALLPKGLTIDDEIRQGQRAAAKLGARIVATDRLSDTTTRLVVVVKHAPTPAQYPRRIGIPSRTPLGTGT